MKQRIMVASMAPLMFLLVGACPDDGEGTTDMEASTSTGLSSAETTLGSSTGMGMMSADVTAGEMTTTGPTDGVDAFLITSIEVRDPHLFDPWGCLDITDIVNDMLAEGLKTDNPEYPDGILDMSMMVVFRPGDQSDGVSGDVDIVNAECTAPLEGTECQLQLGTEPYSSTFTNRVTGICQQADIVHLGGYDPPPGSTSGPCFTTAPIDIFNFTYTYELPLDDVTIAAQYSGDDKLIEGTARGYLSQQDAENVMLPDDLGFVGGELVSALLKGGAGSSASCDGDDRDGAGWWVYIDFTAERVTWLE